MYFEFDGNSLVSETTSTSGSVTDIALIPGVTYTLELMEEEQFEEDEVMLI